MNSTMTGAGSSAKQRKRPAASAEAIFAQGMPEHRGYRPPDRDTLRCAATELHQRGLHPRDIATSLQLSDAAVRQLLALEVAS